MDDSEKEEVRSSVAPGTHLIVAAAEKVRLAVYAEADKSTGAYH